jgi:hypothetical protein
MATVSNWNFFNSNVQSGLLEGRYMNAAFTMLAAGPPRLSAIGTSVSTADENLGNLAWPIGVLQSVNLGINSQWMRLWEIGSERSYFIRGRTVGQLSLGRIMYHGPNLLRSLYAYLDVDSTRGNGQLYSNSAQAKLNTTKTGTNGKNSFKVAPGYQNIWLELASDVFSQPVGLLLYMKDSNEDTVAAFYIEYCNVANFGWSTDAGGTVMSENASIMYERIVPIEMSGVPVIADSTSIENIVGDAVIGSAASPV